MKLEELEKHQEAVEVKDGQVVDVEFEDLEPDPMTELLSEALDWLKTCMHMLDYMANTDILKQIGAKERKVMGQLSDKVGTFLGEAEEAMGDE